MLNVERILFPTDLTPLVEDAFTYAGRMAALFGAELHVLNVAAPHEEEEHAPSDFHPKGTSSREVGALPLGRAESAGRTVLPAR